MIHLGIASHQTAPIIRLAEGSQSRTLFGIFSADLINYPQGKFLDTTIFHNAQHLCIFMYVDGLCIISNSAVELQSMLNECQI